MNPNLVEARIKARHGIELTEEDEYHLGIHAAALLRTWENTYYQYKQGLFSEDEFQADFEVWKEDVPTNHVQTQWQNYRMSYSPDFRSVIDSVSQ